MQVNKISNTSFGIGIRTEYRTVSNTVGHMTINKIQTRNSNHIVYFTNYLHNKPMEKFVRVYNALGELIKCKYKAFRRK